MSSGCYSDNGHRYADPVVSERAIDEPRPLKVIYVGAGISGVCAAIQFPRHVPNVELVIYEKNPEVGGTWYENRYPGCACDIPAHCYQLSYESQVTWSKFYVDAPEILDYWKNVANKHDVRRFMRFGHECVEARWNANTYKWHIKCRVLLSGDIIEDVADVFVTGIGVLNQWKWPNIRGLHEFKGDLLHSANWDTNFDPIGRQVAVIGAGSSGIQIVPALQHKVKHMDHYVRGRTWITASFASQAVQERTGRKDGNFDYTAEEMRLWKIDSARYLEYRRGLEVGMQSTFAITHKESQEQKAARAAFTTDMQERLQKKANLAAQLIPEFPPLCKRLTPGPGYLEALVADNVNVIMDPISHIDAAGIVTNDGVHHPVDTIIAATGFNTTFRGRFPIYGRDGVEIRQQIASVGHPETYLGVAVDGFPNFFQSMGPNHGLGTGNLLLLIETIADYIGQILEKLSSSNVKTIEPKPKAVQNFTKYCQAFFKRTVFSAECDSWYKTPEGRITALWPGSSLHAVQALQKVRFEDYETESADGNDFGWFGDGWTVAERTGDVDSLTWYLKETHFVHEPLQNRHSSNGAGIRSDCHG